MSKQSPKALLAVALVSLLWGTTWLASKWGVAYMPALQLSGLRQLLGGSLYILYFLTKGRALPKGKEWRPVLILSFLNIFLSNGLSTWGVKYISSGLAAIIAAMVPLWIVLISLVSGKASLSGKSIAGFLLGFAGICIIFYDHLNDFLNADFRFGIFLSVLATFSWALGSVYTKEQVKAFNPYFSIGLQMFLSGIALTAVAWLTDQHIPLSEIPLPSWSAIIYLATFGSVMAFMAYLYALHHLPTEQVSIYSYINPIVAVLLGSWIFSERLNIFIVIGGLVAIAGVYLVNESYRKKPDQSASQ
ncbi:DMT family transporter [Flavihumibacter petaseus]|uniref:Putative DMT family transporter n=1 Tax=Flavihumibacter petaseus NBRC 106054 TaxID=1220578 RepID=A0A0E9MW60_9BACT|nr:EamA family transporter [Flavihumibacter petaseus]GAO41829.1 putative DMT family transporter [Flavihumibacter petaseus NBRC 106054]